MDEKGASENGKGWSIMEIQLLKDRILVEKSPQEIRPSGILMLENEKERNLIGEIVNMGPGRFTSNGWTREPMDCKIGDRVVFSIHAGIPTKLYGKDYLVMTESDIICIIPNESIDFISSKPKDYLGGEVI